MQGDTEAKGPGQGSAVKKSGKGIRGRAPVWQQLGCAQMQESGRSRVIKGRGQNEWGVIAIIWAVKKAHMARGAA